MFVRSTDVEALEEQQSTLRGVASLAHFRDKCTTALREARAERDSNTARLDFPVRTETSEGVLTERIESEYRGLFDRINKELRAEQKRADDKTKDELKALEKLNATDPEKLLDGYIKNVVDRELQHAGVMAEAAPQGNATATKVVEAIASAKSKKRLVPWRRPGKRKGLTVQKQRQGQKQEEQQGQEQGQERERTVPRTKKSLQRQRQGQEAQQKLNPVVGKGSRKERRVQRHVVRRAYCRRARASERKKSRVGRLFVSLLKNARAADILHIMHFENLRRQVLVLSPESRSVSEVGVSGVVPWPVIWCLAGYHKSHVWNTGSRPRMEALVQDFQQFAAKVRWKWPF